MKLVTELLKKVGAEHARVLSNPAPEVWFMGFGDSSLNFELLVWTRHVQEKYFTVSEINYGIDAIFRKRGITIPFPQRDLHVKSDERGGMKLDGDDGGES